MSVNVHLTIQVRVEDTTKLDAVEEAVRAVLAWDGLEDAFGPAEASPSNEGQATLLTMRTDRRHPVIISGLYRWEPDVEARLVSAVAAAHGSRCRVWFLHEDADDEGS